MQRSRLFAAAAALIGALIVMVGLAQPTALLSQDNPPRETYDGEPLCGHGRVHPCAICQPTPDYDEKARKKKIEGMVTLSIIVTKDGQTADIKVVKSLTPGLDQQAIKAVSRWRFEPAAQDGQPCPMRVAVQVQFKLY
jgi:TonB family protein